MLLVTEMAPIATFVFLDLETTGLPKEELNKTKITELSLVAVKRSHILETQPGDTPRVQHKLTLCFNPGRPVQLGSTKVTGLCNFVLEHEPPFNKNAFNTINSFLSLLTKPVCFIAHNGYNYDYPILKRHLVALKVSFPDDIVCADSLNCFYDLETKPAVAGSNVFEAIDQGNYSSDEKEDMQKQNELTPKRSNSASTSMMNNHSEQPPLKRKKLTAGPKQTKDVRRKLFFEGGPKPSVSYKLSYIYERYFKRPAVKAHRAENDCLMALECSVVNREEFVQWVENNHCRFADIKPMTVGVPLGCQ